MCLCNLKLCHIFRNFIGYGQFDLQQMALSMIREPEIVTRTSSSE